MYFFILERGCVGVGGEAEGDGEGESSSRLPTEGGAGCEAGSPDPETRTRQKSRAGSLPDGATQALLEIVCSLTGCLIHAAFIGYLLRLPGITGGQERQQTARVLPWRSLWFNLKAHMPLNRTVGTRWKVPQNVRGRGLTAGEPKGSNWERERPRGF